MANDTTGAGSDRMGFQASIAAGLLDTIKGCVDCTKYERQLVSLGDPSIECSTLAIGIQSFPPTAQVGNQCAVYEFRANIVIARCCYPIGAADGSPPPADDITEISLCIADEVEAILCCLQGVSFDVPGAVSLCRPNVFGVAYSRPLGACVSAKIDIRIPGVPCCAT